MQAVVWAVEAWGEMKDSTFFNCWRKAGILPSSWLPTNERQAATEPAAEAGSGGNEGAEADLPDDSVLHELEQLINELPGDAADKVTVAEYVSLPDESTTQRLSSTAEIVQRVLGTAGASDGADGASSSAAEEGDDPDEVPPRIVPLHEAKQMAADLVSFMGDQGTYFSTKEKLFMAGIAGRVQRMAAANLGRTRQTNISDFFRS
jgi:hypothetical protein